jgi:hypothetical protein
MFQFGNPRNTSVKLMMSPETDTYFNHSLYFNNTGSKIFFSKEVQDTFLKLLKNLTQFPEMKITKTDG